MAETTSGPLSRRTVVLGGAGLAAAGAILGTAIHNRWREAGPAAAGVGRGRSSQAAQLVVPGPGADAEMKRWAEQVGSTFTATTDAGPVRLKLWEVKPLESRGVRPKDARPMAFAALFVPQGASLPRGDAIYGLSHPLHGQMSLCLTGAGDDGAAVFN